MPFPSRRCQTCRDRHVKCDESRPTCTQCSKAARTCTWDESDPSSLLFRDENDFASNRAKRRRGGARRSATKSPPQQIAAGTVTVFRLTDRQQLSSTPESVASTTSTTLLLTQPSEVVECHALNKLLRCFVDSEKYLDADLWGFVREYRSDFFPLRPHATFAPAVMAFSLIHFGRTSNSPAAITASRKYYCQALANTREAVKYQSSAIEDEVALTAIVLAGYEDQVGNLDCIKLRSQGFSHLQGVTALITARERAGALSDRSQSLNRFVRRRVTRVSIYYGIAVPLPMEDGQLHSIQPVCDALYKCLVDLATVRNKALMALHAISAVPPHNRSPNLLQIQQIVCEIQELDARLETWRLCLPSSWQYEVHTVSKNQYDYCLASGVFYSRKYHHYADEEKLLNWNDYRAARLVTLGLLVRLASIAPCISQMVAEDNLDIQNTIQSLVEDIAATIPEHLNAIADPPRTREELVQRTPGSTAFHLTWPLIISTATLQIPNQLRGYMKSALLFVSHVSGNASLGKLAGLNLHTHLRLQPQLESD